MVERDNPPLVPVIVSVYVPGMAVAPTEIVSVDVAEPPEGGVNRFGLKDVVTPAIVDALRLVGELKPLIDVTVTVEVPELPMRMLSELGDAETEKSGRALVAVSVKTVDLVRPPPLPVMVIVYAPAGVFVEVPMVRVLVKVGLPLAGENPVEIVVVDGETEDDNDTGWLVPLTKVTVTVGVVLPP